MVTPLKRCSDLIASIVGLIVFGPLMILISIAVLLFDGRPVLFRQERIGKNGVPFTLFKFRSMQTSTDKNAMKITVDGDSRITKIGRILRKSKMDELPQLFNVLFGHMSLVGPRPEVQEYVDKYDDQQRQVLSLKPGVTDPASIKYFNEEDILAAADDPSKTYVETVMPDKIRLNLQYAEKANVIRDFGIILQTIGRVFGIGANAT